MTMLLDVDLAWKSLHFEPAESYCKENKPKRVYSRKLQLKLNLETGLKKNDFALINLKLITRVFFKQ